MDKKIISRVTGAAVALAAALLVSAQPALAQSGENVAVVINDNSADSQKIGQAYAAARSIPDSNVFHIRTSTDETIERAMFATTIEGPLAAAISRGRLQDQNLVHRAHEGRAPSRGRNTGRKGYRRQR